MRGASRPRLSAAELRGRHELSQRRVETASAAKVGDLLHEITSLAAAISSDPEAERNPASLTGGPGFLLQRTTAALTENTLFGINSSSLFERS